MEEDGATFDLFVFFTVRVRFLRIVSRYSRVSRFNPIECIEIERFSHSRALDYLGIEIAAVKREYNSRGSETATNAPSFGRASLEVMGHRPHSSKILEQPTHSAVSPAAEANTRSMEVERQLEDPRHPRLGHEPTSTLPKAVTTQPRATRNDAVIELGRPYDGIHRIRAILAYLKIMNRNNPGFSPILDEAKHMYEQAVSFYDAGDFDGAHELATTSRDLSQTVEIVISRTLRSDSLYPTLVLLPPEYQTTLDDSIRMPEELCRVECLLTLIHRVAENGILHSEDRKQTLNIASCSERLLRKARHLLRFAATQEAIDLVHAAAHAAEHVCKRWYATQSIDPFLPPPHRRAGSDESSGGGSHPSELRAEQQWRG